MSFNSLMTEFCESSDTEELIQHKSEHNKMQVEKPLMPVRGFT